MLTHASPFQVCHSGRTYLVNDAGEDDVLDGVEDDRAVRLACRFSVQPRALGAMEKWMSEKWLQI